MTTQEFLKLPEFRLTRRMPYHNCNCPGRTNVRARQGYYIRAETLDLAIMRMLEHFPQDAQFGFDWEIWKKPVEIDQQTYDDMMAISS